MSIALAMCVSIAAGTSGVLVSTADLPALEDALVVDARSAGDFEAGHIPGAAHLDVDSLSEERAGVRNLLKPMEALRPRFAAAGLETGRPLVVYAGMGKANDLIRATRLFWVLEYVGFSDVRLLDGGLAKWKAEGRPLEQGKSTVASVAAAQLAALAPAESRYATREEVLEAQGKKKGLIVDLRGEDLYAGKTKKDYVARQGHVTGALNHPASTLVEGDFNTFKSAPEIQRLLGGGPGKKTTPVVTYCNSGRSATIGYVAYRIAGFEDVAVYDGSMAEWGNRADCPITGGAG